jgi:glycosyltransferase involved in cell wall biosynthesis
MKKDLISVIIPNYNKGHYIAETLDSLVAQTYDKLEVIIVDDGSTDNSLEIIEEYCKKDSRFFLMQRKREPKGGSVCRNIGLENAKGDFIVFLDSDDLLLPETLERRIKIFEKYSDMDFLVFPTGTFKKQIGDNNSVWIPPVKNHLKKFFMHDLPWNIMSLVWKKDFLLKLHGFDEDYPRLQDVELHTRALLCTNVSYKVFPQVEPDCFYRIDEERIVDNYERFLKKWIDGVIVYIEKISILINNSERIDKKKLLKYLNGTLFSMVSQILYSNSQNKINVERKDIFIKYLLDRMIDIGFLSENTNFLIKIYMKGYEVKMYKVKGYNYIMKRLVSIV